MKHAMDKKKWAEDYKVDDDVVLSREISRFVLLIYHISLRPAR